MVSMNNAVRVFPEPETPLYQVIAGPKNNKAAEIVYNVGIQSVIKPVAFLFSIAKHKINSGKRRFARIKGAANSKDKFVIFFNKGITSCLRFSPIVNETKVFEAELNPQNGTI